MRYLACFCCMISIVFTGCHVGVKKPLNAPLPPAFEDYVEPLEERLTPPKKTTENAWELGEDDIAYIDKTRKLIAFSFDDAPSSTLESILAVFTAYNEENPDCIATASLFLNGGLIDENSLPVLYTANMLGFELANHTHSHLDITTLSQQKLAEEIDRTDDILSKIDGYTRHLLRAPFGRVSPIVKEHSPAPIINWTIDTLDWTKIGEDAIYESVISSLFSGAIVLMHDGYPATVSALKRLLPDLKARGYQVVSVSALAKAHNVPLKIGSEYIRLRKKEEAKPLP